MSIRRIVGSLVGCALLLAVAGCSDSPSAPTPAVGDIRSSIALEGESRLVFQDGGHLDADRATIERIVKQTLTAVRALIPLDGIVVVVLADPSGAIPELGFGGRADAGTVRVWFNPGSSAMAHSLDTDLFPLLAHEMHHVARFRTAGFATNLFDAMISEGLAVHFAVEVVGADPAMWATALSGDALASWTERSRDQWFNSDYNHNAWFFGASASIPRWAGYSIGFELTRKYLQAHPGRRPSNLFAESGSSFVPPDASS